MISKPQQHNYALILLFGYLVFALLTITVAPVAITTADETDEPPPVPATYYGSVSIGDEPASAGTKIVAFVDGTETGSITVEEAGQYGGETATEPKLTIPADGDVDLERGDDIIIKINGVEANESPIQWVPGTLKRIDLSIDETSDSGDDPVPSPPDDEPEDPVPEELSQAEIEDFVNVPEGLQPIRAERVDTVSNTTMGTSTATFSGESPVESVTIKKNIDIPIIVTEYDTEPKLAGSSPGESVVVTQITVPDRIQNTEARIVQRASTVRLQEMNASAENLRITHFSNGSWHTLETDILEETGTHTRVAANISSFSFFSVSVVDTPEAVLDITPQSSEVGERVVFDASDSIDRYGEIVTYKWSIQNETFSGEEVTATFDEAGEYDVKLTVENGAGETDTQRSTVTIESAVGEESFFEVTDIDVLDEAGPSDALNVSVSITNSGNLRGTTTVVYEFSNTTKAEDTIELDPGETTTLTFTATPPNEEGEYTHRVSTSNDTETTVTYIQVTDDLTPEVTPTSTTENESDDSFGTGFGVLVALVGLLSSTFMLYHWE
jgi:PGF-pre-PGF domain-containing protein